MNDLKGLLPILQQFQEGRLSVQKTQGTNKLYCVEYLQLYWQHGCCTCCVSMNSLHFCEILGYGRVAEDSSLLGCDPLSLGIYFLVFLMQYNPLACLGATHLSWCHIPEDFESSHFLAWCGTFSLLYCIVKWAGYMNSTVSEQEM